MHTGRRNRRTAIVLFAAAGGMVALSFASVPLYRMFCQVTGYNGTPRIEQGSTSAGSVENTVRVTFDANTSRDLPWRFVPDQREIRLRLGEEYLATYSAHNLSQKVVTGSAVFNVTPEKVATYFTKIECFCFTEQVLQPGQDVSMPVLFYVDPAILDDPDARDVKAITLSYTFYPATGDTPAAGAAAKGATSANSPQAGLGTVKTPGG
jgi:cytochrome c oxidase assembly protein subunit 11